MGSSCCKTDDSHRIDEGIHKDKIADREIKKLLLLGAGSSGKSTFFKQLKVIHGDGFSNKDRRDYQAQIENQIITQMQKLIVRGRELMEDDGDSKYADLEIVSNEAKEAAAYLDGLPPQQSEFAQARSVLAQHIKTLWRDEGIQNIWSLRGQISVPDSCAYFFENIDRISEAQYMPSDEDILLVRKRTTGIIEEHFTIQTTKFHICDVGGQRNERKKWIHCFDNVTAVIFVASLSSYNEVLLEDESVIVMHEELNLFEQICNSRWFTETAFILFLNKRDLFNEKFEATAADLSKCFPAFKSTGYGSAEKAMDFIREEFLARNQNQHKQIYAHFTCATDRDNVEKIFNDVQQVVVSTSLKGGGLI
mmetsp:Transcript_52734/g.87353  ORF Transcript_52734/g.87353 Transcript_52734/m.87353 type:complete len:364 (+) Transcript_52734:89-1180(+)